VGSEGEDCIDLVQGRNKWRALAIMVINFWVIQNAGTVLAS
jgi:hypothetical protein